MGKSKKGSSKATPAAAPKCTCDHPFNCDCGNRPPRPSRGHQWDSDTQSWGGKGHKQKGASGQTASTAEATKTTSVGKTQVAQWQRLPSTLLKEYCQREKRKPPKMRNISKSADSYLVRVILPDSKDPDKDLFFVPAKAVDNEEQATEEACILALLHQTPSLPHERKLPEPYRTTWLHAIENIKNNNSNNNKSTSKTGKSNNSNATNGTPSTATTTTTNNCSNSNNSSGEAKASTSLKLGKTYISNASRKQQQEELKRERNKRIRQHEALRMANKNHPVFLSARLRRQIQQLLRGDSTGEMVLLDLEDDDEDEDKPEDAELDDGQVYVVERLRTEGFTKRQARTALQSIDKGGSSNNVSEDKWDDLYEESLQWLCIHLDEDQLPEGFDPRFGALEVIAPGKGMESQMKTSASSTKGNDGEVTEEISELALKYGISNREAKLVVQQAEMEKSDVESVLWEVLLKASGTSLASSEVKSDENLNAMQEEIETLEAIYPAEFQAKTQGNSTILTIKVTDVDTDMTLQAVVQNGLYPFAYPKRLLLFGKWPKSSLHGAATHVEIIKFLSTLELGNPQIFEIYGHVQTTFHSISSGELEPLSLLPALGVEDVPQRAARSQAPSTTEKTTEINKKQPDPTATPRKVRRPRERATFWSTPPAKTPFATAFPKIDNSMDRARKSLPAFKARKEFLAAMSKAEQGGRVVLVTGDTGCGKTTQIPQFILEEAPKDAKIVVAQPRRLAATGVASRVANERGENQPGRGSVGYVVRGDSAMCPKTRLAFCTTGVLLRQLQCEGALENITHIIVDEVHERNLDSDVLLCFLKLTLKDYPKLRVVLMSATLEAEKFASYWGTNTPQIHIPGRTFPVTDFLLEDVLSATGYIPPKDKRKKRQWQGNQKPKKASPWADSEKSDEESGEEGTDIAKDTAISSTRPGGANKSIPLEDLVKRVDETDLDYDLLAHLVCHLVQNKGPEDDGSILVFLSGAPEINNAMETIKRFGSNLSMLVLPLHGGLQPKDQHLVFQSPKNGLTKVILATNVAETSITIPDCTIVIDSCREKQSSYDPINRMPLLLEQFASRASLKQRRGRAGRVREGVCYKLISRSTYEKLKEHGDPEIRRCALDQTLLSLLFLGVERGTGTFMNKLMDPPSQNALESAIFSLRKLGALTSGDGPGEVILTPFGMHLAGIPAPPSVGKLLVMGCILGCRKAAIAMAAGISVGRSPFLRIDSPSRNRRGNNDDEKSSIEDMKKERVLEERKALFAKVGNSDHSVLVAAFLQWEQTSAGGGGRKRLCDSLGLSFNGMRDMLQLFNQYDSSLRAAGYVDSHEADRNMTSWLIIRACAVAALAPSQLVRVQRPTTKYVATVEGAFEKDAVAKELKFFIRGSVDDQHDAGNPTSTISSGKHDERVFIHPSSFNFAVGSYSCPWLVYHSMVRTSKPFLRDVSECSAYALLLFAGDMDVQAKEGIVVIDGWVKLDAKARVGSLIGGLRQRVDNLLAKKIDNPSFDLAGTNEMKLIVTLLVSNGTE